jgi:galactose mutarotase-like enzyme
MVKGNRTETPVTLHGRVANIPASYVDLEIIPGDPPRIRVTGIVEESTIFFPRLQLRTAITTVAGTDAFTITDEVVNLKNTETDIQLLYHCNVGRPFLEENAELLVPASETAPRDLRAASGMATWNKYGKPETGFAEQCYFHVPAGDEQGNTLSLLKNAAGDKGIVIRFNTQQLPCFTQWKNTAEESAGYVTGMEPATNFPNLKSFERKQGRTVLLQPGESCTAEITFEVHGSASPVAGAEKEIARIQGGLVPAVHAEPQPHLSSSD